MLITRTRTFSETRMITSNKQNHMKQLSLSPLIIEVCQLNYVHSMAVYLSIFPADAIPFYYRPIEREQILKRQKWMNDPFVVDDEMSELDSTPQCQNVR